MNAPDILTFGCRLNTYESEVMRAHAQAGGLEDAVIVMFRCLVTGNEAERWRAFHALCGATTAPDLLHSRRRGRSARKPPLARHEHLPQAAAPQRRHDQPRLPEESGRLRDHAVRT